MCGPDDAAAGSAEGSATSTPIPSAEAPPIMARVKRVCFTFSPLLRLAHRIERDAGHISWTPDRHHAHVSLSPRRNHDMAKRPNPPLPARYPVITIGSPH